MDISIPLFLSDVDGSIIMYIFGIVFGVLSILYFARDILVSLSVTVKSMVLYSIAALILSGSIVVGSSVLTIILLLFCGFMYTAATVYVWNMYNFEKIGKFLLLAISSVLLLGVGRSLQSNIFQGVDAYILLSIGMVPLILTFIVSIFDILEDNPVKYEIEFEEKINDPNPRDQEIGTIKVINNSRFRRKYDIPSYNIMISDMKETSVPHGFKSDTIGKNNNTIGTGQEISGRISVSPEKTKERLDVNTSGGFSISVIEREHKFKIEDYSEEIDVEIQFN